MFQTWRVQLKEVQAALAAGHLDRASALMETHQLAQYQPGGSVSIELAAALIDRAARRIATHQYAQCWGDLCTADRISSSRQGELVIRVREQLIEALVAEAALTQSSGRHEAVVQCIDELATRGLIDHRLAAANAALRHWQLAQADARRGAMASAVDHLLVACQSQPTWTWLQSATDAMQQRADTIRSLEGELHAALSAADSGVVLAASQQLLALAPEHPRARAARQDAWREVGGPRMADTVARPIDRRHGNGRPAAVNAVAGNGRMAPPRIGAVPIARTGPIAQGGSSPMHPDRIDAEGIGAEQDWVDRVQAGPQRVDDRFMLWVDGVGSYLVCPGDDLLIGAPSESTGVDIAVAGDLSRRAAALRRQANDYIVQPLSDVRINGTRCHRAQTLRHGDELQFGGSIRFRVCKPHPLSGSLRLEMLSRHRLEPACDGLILLADTCVLGPAASAHIPCPHWQHELVVFRRDAQLLVRCGASLTVDGRGVEPRTITPLGTRLEGLDFALSVETFQRPNPLA
jgi:hypothetical protein